MYDLVLCISMRHNRNSRLRRLESIWRVIRLTFFTSSSFNMPPKLDIDVKLEQLRGYIAANLSQLASVDRTTLQAIFAARKRESNADANFYRFLWSNERTFTDAQRAHAEETMALVNKHRANSGDAHPGAAVGRENSGDGQPAAGGVTLAMEARGKGGDAESSGVSQPAAKKGATSNAAASSGVLQALADGPAKEAKNKAVDKEATSKNADRERSSVSQLATTKRKREAGEAKNTAVESGGVSQPAAAQRSKKSQLDRSAPRALVKKNDYDKVLYLRLKRPQYEAITDRRKLWEARPLRDGESHGWRQSIYDKLAQVGRIVVLKSGAGTNVFVWIAEVRRYTTDPLRGEDAVRDMVLDLDADLLPDASDHSARVKIYTDLYGIVFYELL